MRALLDTILAWTILLTMAVGTFTMLKVFYNLL